VAATAVVWAYAARADLFAALKYLVEQSPQAAANLLADVEAAADTLTAFPDRGARVPELRMRDLRQLFVGRYRLIYRVPEDDACVRIVRLIHGSQDLRRAFRRAPR
jgi:toxin ParE1/3/4